MKMWRQISTYTRTHLQSTNYKNQIACKRTMKIVTWNINGLSAVLRKGNLQNYNKQEHPDILALQETRLSTKREETVKEETNLALEESGWTYDYNYYHTSTVKAGYSGTACFSKQEPLSVRYGICDTDHDGEGRSISLEFDNFVLLNLYVPNAGQKETKKGRPKRLGYRMQWDIALSKYINILNKETNKPVIVCGDLNICPEEIDLANPAQSKDYAGFTMEERQGFKNMILQTGLEDAWRKQNPFTVAYTWWSYSRNARQKNIGWRLDYFLTSPQLSSNNCSIRSNVIGSDHCPVIMQLSI